MGSSRSIDIDTDFSPAALARILLERLKLSPATRFQLAYSGGLDSHVLLHALAQLQRTHGLNLGAVHVDHGLQAASRDWAQHCARICAALGIPCIIERVQVPDARADGLEAAARRARYACLARHVGAGDALLTAHHLDDQAETVLLQLLRGAGVHGLAAMPAIAPFSAGVLARPLLGFTRTALAHYARAEKLQWIEDSSNRDLRRARNLVRHQVLPLLQQRWPAAVRQLAQTARHAAEAAALLDDLAGADLGACATGAAL
ncbi:MAG: tRNA lysidine(34) synthetase TilS, partial [Candidatus Muproteobacteria bacterium RBG_16_64_10]